MAAVVVRGGVEVLWVNGDLFQFVGAVSTSTDMRVQHGPSTPWQGLP